MRLGYISWLKAKEYFEVNSTAVITVGSLENHGTHLALGTDTIIPEKIIELSECKTDVLFAPVLPYGMADHHYGFPGTISLGQELLTQVLMKITMQLMECGVKRFVFLNGHGGNVAPMDTVSVEINKRGGIAAIFSWYSVAGAINPGWSGGHAAGQEMSAMLYAEPSCVDVAAVKESPLCDLSDTLPASGLSSVAFRGIDIPVKRLFINVTPYGWGGGTDFPEKASREWGKEMVETIADYFAGFVNEFKNVPLTAPASINP